MRRLMCIFAGHLVVWFPRVIDLYSLNYWRWNHIVLRVLYDMKLSCVLVRHDISAGALFEELFKTVLKLFQTYSLFMRKILN